MRKPTDEEIIQVLTERGNCMTYFVTNVLRRQFWPLDTAYVLRRLKKLEEAGKVKRVKSAYKTQLCWEAAQ
ncbi:TPA: hypothetical protein LUJ02_000547 [Salmonella enterica subsp. enterica]|uniref:hypothetical protein n=1 Tax=Salmonella enterica TaxID=28901 RepID=UPI0012C4E368|nr:hypothetical protein [Salmonella enterica]HBM1692947.1 hypothetical protein [Salmonella enterica subsp. enterica]EBY0917185.1 hypothetical protein [Salmonella enterica subsp. enterica serovar Kentucky]EBY3641022.1 hypothetical protein [Salmonella enterica subsp. enterica serovar Kentucky]EBZ6853684.1 hypothetical protein [Salmonella enterica subsp. enterica serovar Kentucky]ECA6949941.1 hypothetical protein [Salmonella enterica subsp. enterica serovar Kentucky]